MISRPLSNRSHPARWETVGAPVAGEEKPGERIGTGEAQPDAAGSFSTPPPAAILPAPAFYSGEITCYQGGIALAGIG